MMDGSREILLPNWVKCKIGDFAYLKNGFAFKSTSYQDEGIPVVRISDISAGSVSLERAVKVKYEDNFESFTIRRGDILIAMSGATTGKFGVYKTDSIALQNQRVGNLRPLNVDTINKQFLFYFLYSAKREIEKRAYGGAQPNISSEKIETIPICLPPLAEQHRIVDKIEELFSDLDDGITSLKKAQQQLKVYRQAVLKWAFEDKLTAQWREEQKWQGKLESAETLLEQIKTEREQRYQAELAQWQAEVEAWEANGKVGKKPVKPKIFEEFSNVTKEDIVDL